MNLTCGPETPKGWTPLVHSLSDLDLISGPFPLKAFMSPIFSLNTEVFKLLAL